MPPEQEVGFELREGLEFRALVFDIYWSSSGEGRARRFSALQLSLLLHHLIVTAIVIKLKVNVISSLS